MNGTGTRWRGRPLAFLLLLCVGWTGMRVGIVSLWPEVAEPSAFAPLVAAVEDQPALAPTAGTNSVDDAPLAPLEGPAPAAVVVEGLEPAPPAHMEAPPMPLPEAAGHNALWMAAAGLESTPSAPASDQTDLSELPQ